MENVEALVLAFTSLLLWETLDSVCPTDCYCWTDHGDHLKIDCSSRPIPADSQQRRQDADILLTNIDDLLSGRDNLTSQEEKLYTDLNQIQLLDITNSCLTEVPLSVCQLTALKSLNLENNHFRRLPDNCFTNLTWLNYLNANNNSLEELQDGLFDGLNQLHEINCVFNHISKIGFKLFSNITDMTSLRSIDLSNNHLKSVDSWPYARGLAARNPNDQIVYVRLAYNHITELTNHARLRMGCDTSYPRPFLTIDLSANNFNYYSSMLRGYDLDNFTEALCFTGKLSRRFRHSNVHILFYYNYLTCDCTDFDYLAGVQYAVKNPIFDEVFCRESERSGIIETPIVRVPLLNFYCDVVDRCPT